MRLINLETSITTSEAWWRGKEIHYRMHPANIGCLTAARSQLRSLRMTPMRVRRFREDRASAGEVEWLRNVLSREGERFGTHAVLEADGTLMLRWD